MEDKTRFIWELIFLNADQLLVAEEFKIIPNRLGYKNVGKR